MTQLANNDHVTEARKELGKRIQAVRKAGDSEGWPESRQDEFDGLCTAFDALPESVQQEIAPDVFKLREEERRLRRAYENSPDARTVAKNSTPAGAYPANGDGLRLRDATTGQEIRALEKGDSFAEHVRNKSGTPDGYSAIAASYEDERTAVGLAGALRAMVGASNVTDTERRALSEGTDSAGGYTVPDILSAQLIDKLRANSVAFRAGAITVPMTSDVLKIAKLATDPTATWRSENASISDNSPTFGVVTFTARSLVSLVRVSRELVEDSLNLEAALTNAFSQAMALEVDRVALVGSGSAPEPEGIVNVTNVGSTSMGTNGAALTSYDEILDALQVLLDANAGMPTAGVLAPRTQIELAKLKDSDNQPLMKPEILRDIPMLATTQVPVDDTQGSATDASKIILGNYRELFVGVRSQLRIELLRERYSDNFQYGFLAHLRADIQVAHPESFSMLIGVIPPS